MGADFSYSSASPRPGSTDSYRSESVFTPLRREDPALLSGQGRFSADIRPERAAFVAFARSMYAKGRVRLLDVSEASSMPGVCAVLTARDLGDAAIPSINPLLPLLKEVRFPLLADEEVAWAGQALAVVVAETPQQARAAAEAVRVDIDPLPPAGDFDDTDPVTTVSHQWSDAALDSKPRGPIFRAEVALDSPRLVAMALEPRAVTVEFHPSERALTVWLASQSPARARTDIAAALGIEAPRVRVIASDVGGAFGARASVVPEDLLVPWAAWRLERSLRWVADRSEEFSAGMHGRGSRAEGALTLDQSGRLETLEARLAFGLGAWMPFSSVVPLRNAARIMPGPYRIQHLKVDGVARLSNGSAVNIYRGAGRPEATLLMETLVERAARAAGLDPVDLRRRNLIAASDLPYRTPTGETLDSGNYLELLDRACVRFDYLAARHLQAQRRRLGEWVGIGTALYVEPCGQGWEAARVTLHADGRVTVASGSPAQGQGHLTTFARIAAEALGCHESMVTVQCGDTALCPEGVGALASRSTAIGGSAIVSACHQVLEAREAGAAYPIVAETRFTAKEAWSSGCVMAAIRLDIETGAITVERIVWIDDAGRVIHPELAHGQLMGGLAQGLGQAMMERIVYDENGQLLTGSLMDYAVPRAADMPEVITESINHPSPNNLLGAKGVGEAGCIGVPAALMNAARDALAELGEVDLQFPLTPPRVWRAIQAHRRGRDWRGAV